MNHRNDRTLGLLLIVTLALSIGVAVDAQIPDQLAQDFVAGTVPSPEDVAKFEKEAAAKPGDLHLTRKLGKAYFFQFFGEGDADAVPKAQRTFERALVLKKDDAETLSYFGSLYILQARRLNKADPAKQKANYERGFEMLKLAEKLEPRHGAVLSINSASYLWLPDHYNMAPHVVQMLEGMMKGMGQMFQKFSHHGQQRLLLTLGQAYARIGDHEKAGATFAMGLSVNGKSLEAGLIKAEIAKLKK